MMKREEAKSREQRDQKRREERDLKRKRDVHGAGRWPVDAGIYTNA